MQQSAIFSKLRVLLCISDFTQSSCHSYISDELESRFGLGKGKLRDHTDKAHFSTVAVSMKSGASWLIPP